MEKRYCRTFSSAFKAKVVPAANNGLKSIPDLSWQLDIQTKQITRWNHQLLMSAVDIFDNADYREPPVDV